MNQSDQIPEGKVAIRAYIVNEHNITLYDTKGNTYVLQNTHFRTREIIDQITPDVARHRDSIIDLGSFQAHREFEQKTGRLTRFFRVAKSLVANIFAPQEGAKNPTVEDIEQYGQQTSTLNVHPTETIVALVDMPSPEALIQEAEKQVLTSGISSPVVNKPVPQPQPEAVIADVQKVMERQTKIIPEMEKLETQFAHAVKNDSVEGMQNFLRRLGAIIDQRGHTVQDLLSFLEKGDLPIASNGDVIGYKALKKRPDGRYADVHSGRVSQTIGSMVQMDPKLVDPSRNRDCSYGLHIGRRDYMGNFGGDVIVLCRIRPEDFIAVPSGYASKVRVCGYHIVAELPKEAEQLVRSGKPMTTITAMAQLLGDILAGNHVPVTETVTLLDQAADKTTIIPTKQNNVKASEPTESAPVKVMDHEPLGTLQDAQTEVEKVTPAEIRARLSTIVAEDTQSGNEEAANEPTEQETGSQATAENGEPQEAGPAAETVQPVVQTPDQELAKPAPVKKGSDLGVQANVKPSKKEQARVLYDRWHKGQLPGDLKNLYDFKRGAKKGWDVLGFKTGEINEIENALEKLGHAKKK